MRDGIDDVRYLQALDRTIAAAEAKLCLETNARSARPTFRKNPSLPRSQPSDHAPPPLGMTEGDPPAELAAALEHARQTRHECYESIGGRWFHYIGGLVPCELDQVRRRLADAAVELSHAVD